jgi:hypothetical protein
MARSREQRYCANMPGLHGTKKRAVGGMTALIALRYLTNPAFVVGMIAA